MEKYLGERLVSESAEYYSFRFTHLDDAAYVKLIYSLYKGTVYVEMGAIVENMAAQVEIDGKLFNFTLNVYALSAYYDVEIMVSYFVD